MFLIDKNGKRPICRECRRLHGAKGCPRRKAIDWKEIERVADDFCARMDAYWGRRLKRA